jgi:hypothetical protein
MLINVKQLSNEWYSLKSKTIGSSEIYALIFHYITPNELQKSGINADEFTEKPYTTAWHLYHKFQNPHCYVDFELNTSAATFGRKIEEYALHYLQSKDENNAQYKRGSVYVDGISIASLDIEGKALGCNIINDINGYAISTADDQDFVVEVKAQSNFQSAKNKIITNGIDWKFIFQLQYQMMISKLNWGKILVFNLNSDNEFERGRISEMSKQRLIKYIELHSKCYEFTYKARAEYQFLITKAIERFETDLLMHNEPQLPDWDVISKSTTKKQCHEMICKLTEQRSKLLENDTNVIESNAFDRLFSVKSTEERFERVMSKLQWKIRQTMLTHGKTKITSDKGTITMQSNAIVCRPAKPE